ncbi:MAG: hypothetical protein MJ245_00365 [Clostridia bacterium]|nr:hypothetical protein [Clostridia bacterium]
MKLRLWVKVVLVGLVFGGLIALDNKTYNDAVDQCVNAGHDVNYCESGLR